MNNSHTSNSKLDNQRAHLNTAEDDVDSGADDVLPIEGLPSEHWIQRAFLKTTKRTARTVKLVVKDFNYFITRGTVFDLAIGLIMGAAFTKMYNEAYKA
jgi:Large-conductance mechanosensitive channel, MscL